MNTPKYFVPKGGHPETSQLYTDRAVFTEAYALIPGSVMRDIVTSYLPHWDKTRLWVLARPMSGFAETFSQYIVEVGSGGGSTQPENNPDAEAVLFVVGGVGTLTMDGDRHDLKPGSYVFLPPATDWTLANDGDRALTFHWIRKQYQPAEGIPKPKSIVTHEDQVAPTPMPGSNGRWSTKRFVELEDLSHDMHVTIVSLEPDESIPFAETHVMEHGLYVLEGCGVYRLNKDWVEVQAGDFMWLRAFCPQACYATGTGPFRYLLYKDVNRHMPLSSFPPIA